MATRRQTRQLKSAFLAAFAECGNVSTACRVSGAPRWAVYEWKDSDRAFATAYAEAELQAVEVLEEEARRRAVEGVTRTKYHYWDGALIGQHEEKVYSDTLLIFLLKAHNPRKYRETYRHEHSGPDGGPIEIDDIRDRLAQRVASLAAAAGADTVPVEPE